MACWPWIITYKAQEVDLAGEFSDVRPWYDTMKQRPALRRGYDLGKDLGKPTGNWGEETKISMMEHRRK